MGARFVGGSAARGSHVEAVEAVVEALRAIRDGEWTPSMAVVRGLATALDVLQARAADPKRTTG